MTRARGWGAAALVLSGLAGCGFTPLYSQQGGQETALGQINVALIGDRNGQLLRQDLQDLLDRSGGGVSSRYDLYVGLGFAVSQLGTDPQSASTRERDLGSASWTLKAEDAGHTTLTSGTAHALDGFDIINQQFFAADMSREASLARIDDALAQQIVQQLAVYFRQHPPS
jgi:LPS-assembly lipoprotein